MLNYQRVTFLSVWWLLGVTLLFGFLISLKAWPRTCKLHDPRHAKTIISRHPKTIIPGKPPWFQETLRESDLILLDVEDHRLSRLQRRLQPRIFVLAPRGRGLSWCFPVFSNICQRLYAGKLVSTQSLPRQDPIDQPHDYG